MASLTSLHLEVLPLALDTLKSLGSVPEGDVYHVENMIRLGSIRGMTPVVSGTQPRSAQLGADQPSEGFPGCIPKIRACAGLETLEVGSYLSAVHVRIMGGLTTAHARLA